MKEGEGMIDGISGMINSRMRLTGISSGLDTDSIVEQLMRVERMKVDRVIQDRQLLEWKRDDYRSITNLLRGFKDQFFNVLKPANYMFSPNNYKKYNVTSTDSNVVTAMGTSTAVAGSHTVTVKNLATADEALSVGTVTRALQSKEVITAGVDSDIVNAGGKKINITLDGVTREITMGDYTESTTVEDLASDLQGKINIAFGVNTVLGEGKILVTESGGKINFEATGGASRITLAGGSTDDGLSCLHFDSGASNRINVSEKLESLASKLSNGLTFDDNGNLAFSINSKNFTFSKTTTLWEMMSTINRDSDAKVNIMYDESTDKFKITAKQLGAGDNIKITQSGGSFFDGASMISTGSPVTNQGQDAVVIIDGETLARSSNTVTVNGVTYTLLKESGDISQTISLKQDVEGIYDNIKSFIEKYNEMIETINNKLAEKFDRKFPPLTDEQKEAMNEKDIEKWEKKAKVGLLRNDRLIENIVTNIRRALYDGIKGVNTTLAGIGISSTSYHDKGKLTIDEAKLKAAIQNDPDGVMNLFCRQSTSHPGYARTLSPDERKARYEEQGLAYRIYDIVEDNISTFRDSYGNKGLLLERAGIEGDMTEFGSAISDQINQKDTLMETLLDKLYRKEEMYYAKFAAMEKVLEQMNSQSAWLYQQFQSGQR
jgi:flagellar hook-associated protein 2